MKVTIVVNGEEMYSGEAKACMVLMPKENEIQIAFDTPPFKKNKL